MGDGPNPFDAGSSWRWDDPSLVAMQEHLRTGQPVRIEDVAESIAGAPVDAGIEEPLAEFTELLATAISSSETREQLARLADEQAALRRVATLVARGAPPTRVFDAVAEELGRLLDAASSGLVRFEDENTATVVAGWGRLGEEVPTGARLPIGGVNVVTKIARSASRLASTTSPRG